MVEPQAHSPQFLMMVKCFHGLWMTGFQDLQQGFNNLTMDMHNRLDDLQMDMRTRLVHNKII